MIMARLTSVALVFLLSFAIVFSPPITDPISIPGVSDTLGETFNNAMNYFACQIQQKTSSHMFVSINAGTKSLDAILFYEDQTGAKKPIAYDRVWVWVYGGPQGGTQEISGYLTNDKGQISFDTSKYSKGCYKFRFIYCPLTYTGDGNSPILESQLKENPACLASSKPSLFEVPAESDLNFVDELSTIVGQTPPENYKSTVYPFYGTYEETQYCPVNPATQFAFCMPLVIIFALLGGALYLSGKNPLGGFDFTTPRMGKHVKYNPSGRGTAFDVGGAASALGSMGSQIYQAKAASAGGPESPATKTEAVKGAEKPGMAVKGTEKPGVQMSKMSGQGKKVESAQGRARPGVSRTTDLKQDQKPAQQQTTPYSAELTKLGLAGGGAASSGGLIGSIPVVGAFFRGSDILSGQDSASQTMKGKVNEGSAGIYIAGRTLGAILFNSQLGLFFAPATFVLGLGGKDLVTEFMLLLGSAFKYYAPTRTSAEKTFEDYVLTGEKEKFKDVKGKESEVLKVTGGEGKKFGDVTVGVLLIDREKIPMVKTKDGQWKRAFDEKGNVVPALTGKEADLLGIVKQVNRAANTLRDFGTSQDRLTAIVDVLNKYGASEKDINSWLKEAKEELKNPNSSSARKAEVGEEIRLYEAALGKYDVLTETAPSADRIVEAKLIILGNMVKSKLEPFVGSASAELFSGKRLESLGELVNLLEAKGNNVQQFKSEAFQLYNEVVQELKSKAKYDPVAKEMLERFGGEKGLLTQMTEGNAAAIKSLIDMGKSYSGTRLDLPKDHEVWDNIIGIERIKSIDAQMEFAKMISQSTGAFIESAETQLEKRNDRLGEIKDELADLEKKSKKKELGEYDRQHKDDLLKEQKELESQKLDSIAKTALLSFTSLYDLAMFDSASKVRYDEQYKSEVEKKIEERGKELNSIDLQLNDQQAVLKAMANAPKNLLEDQQEKVKDLQEKRSEVSHEREGFIAQFGGREKYEEYRGATAYIAGGKEAEAEFSVYALSAYAARAALNPNTNANMESPPQAKEFRAGSPEENKEAFAKYISELNHQSNQLGAQFSNAMEVYQAGKELGKLGIKDERIDAFYRTVDENAPATGLTLSKSTEFIASYFSPDDETKSNVLTKAIAKPVFEAWESANLNGGSSAENLFVGPLSKLEEQRKNTNDDAKLKDPILNITEIYMKGQEERDTGQAKELNKANYTVLQTTGMQLFAEYREAPSLTNTQKIGLENALDQFKEGQITGKQFTAFVAEKMPDAFADEFVARASNAQAVYKNILDATPKEMKQIVNLTENYLKIHKEDADILQQSLESAESAGVGAGSRRTAETEVGRGRGLDLSTMSKQELADYVIKNAPDVALKISAGKGGELAKNRNDPIQEYGTLIDDSNKRQLEDIASRMSFGVEQSSEAAKRMLESLYERGKITENYMNEELKNIENKNLTTINHLQQVTSGNCTLAKAKDIMKKEIDLEYQKQYMLNSSNEHPSIGVPRSPETLRNEFDVLNEFSKTGNEHAKMIYKAAKLDSKDLKTETGMRLVESAIDHSNEFAFLPSINVRLQELGSQIKIEETKDSDSDTEEKEDLTKGKPRKKKKS
jgi:hypothetical protein